MKSATYRAKPKQSKRFFMSEFFKNLQKKISEKKIFNVSFKQLKEMQFKEIIKDGSSEAYLADYGLNLLKLNIEEDELKWQIIEVKDFPLTNEPHDLREFCQKYFWELIDFLAVDHRGYGEMLNNLRDFFYTAKTPSKNDILKIIDSLVTDFKNEQIDLSKIGSSLDNLYNYVCYATAPREEKIYYLEAIHDMKTSMQIETLVDRIPHIERISK